MERRLESALKFSMTRRSKHDLLLHTCRCTIFSLNVTVIREDSINLNTITLTERVTQIMALHLNGRCSESTLTIGCADHPQMDIQLESHNHHSLHPFS